MDSAEQVKQLKINVTNIKSVLVKGREQERKIISKKVAFTKKEKRRERRIEKENSLEKIRIPTFGVAGLVASTTSGIFGGIMGFLGNILAGYIVKRLPEIIAKAQEIYENDIKPMWEGAKKTLGSIFNGIKFVFTGINNFFNPTSAQKNIDETEKSMKNLNKEIDGDISFYTNILKSVGFDVSMFEEPEKEQPDVSEPLNMGTVDSQQESKPVRPSMRPQRRNEGGEVLKTKQPKQVPVGDPYYSNPMRSFPRVANKNLANTEAFKKNVGKFGELVKLLKSSKFMGKKPTGGGGGYGGEVSKLMGSGGGALSGFTDEDWKYLGFVVSAEAQRDTDDEYGVAASVLNRVASKDWPNTIKGVIFQRNQYEAVYKGLSRHDPALVAKLRSSEGQAKIVDALNKLQGRTDFKGTTQYANYVPGEDIKFSSRGNFFHYSWQTGRNSVKPSNFTDVDYQRFISKKNLGPVSKNNGNKGLIAIQPVVKEVVREVPVPIALNSNSGSSNVEQFEAYQDLFSGLG
jgi:hypothetical protein